MSTVWIGSQHFVENGDYEADHADPAPDRAMSFMIHDKWENALFLHWLLDVDSTLGKALRAVVPEGLVLDRFDFAGSGKECYAIGLVLLTERGVGPGRIARPLFKSLSQVSECAGLGGAPFLVTHYGCNLRTYVQGDGIFFLSLECDSLLASFGANRFGIPYHMAEMSRHFLPSSDGSPCKDDRFRLATSRGHDKFQVEARWSAIAHKNGEDNEDADQEYAWTQKAEKFVERYFVYTKKYGMLWRGRVAHEPWPLRRVDLEEMLLKNVETYESAACDAAGIEGVRGILSHMAKAKPSHACFSSGVGPVEFEFLKTMRS